MELFCPNLSNKQIKEQFEELVDVLGEDRAYLVWAKTDGQGLGNNPGSDDQPEFKQSLEKNNGDRAKTISQLSDEVLKQKPAIQSIYNVAQEIDNRRDEYIKQSRQIYIDSNSDLTQEELDQNLPRIENAARIQFNERELDKILSEQQKIIAESLGLSFNGSYYIQRSGGSSNSQSMLEFIINSLNKDTFTAYQRSDSKVYNILHPDKNATLNLIYQSIYDGDLSTTNKELARSYIRTFWYSDLIQAGFKLLKDDGVAEDNLEQSLVDAITTEPSSGTQDSWMSYILRFWDELKELAKKYLYKIYQDKNVSE